MKTSFQKAILDSENVMSTKLPKKKFAKIQKLLCWNSQKSCRNVLNKIFFCFKVPSGQLKCSFENPAAKFSPGVSKSLPQCRIESFKELFFQKIFPRKYVLDILTAILTSPLKKRPKVQSLFGQIPENLSFRNFCERKYCLLGKVRLDIGKARLTTLMKKNGGRSWNFW